VYVGISLAVDGTRRTRLVLWFDNIVIPGGSLHMPVGVADTAVTHGGDVVVAAP
jgi:hypothetical protein